MAKREKSAVEKYHDRVAGIYDTIYDGNPYWDVVFELTWRHLLKFISRDLSTRVLDVGCGTGRWGLRLAKSGYRVDFLDISEKMLDQVAGKAARLNLNYEPVLYHASIDDLSELEKGQYGFIVGQGDPLNCALKPERALKELTGLLAPGGTMVMSVDNRWQGLFHYFKNGDLPGLKEFLKTGRTNWVTDDPTEQYPLVMFTPDQLRQMLAARGLELLSLIGKTVLPLRRFKEFLAGEEARRELLRLEESLHATEALFANAAHLEFAARKPAS